MQTSFVEMLEGGIAAFLPCIFTLLLFNKLVNCLSSKRMGTALLPKGDGFKFFPRSDIDSDRHGDSG